MRKQQQQSGRKKLPTQHQHIRCKHTHTTSPASKCPVGSQRTALPTTTPSWPGLPGKRAGKRPCSAPSRGRRCTLDSLCRESPMSSAGPAVLRNFKHRGLVTALVVHCPVVYACRRVREQRDTGVCQILRNTGKREPDPAGRISHCVNGTNQ